MLKFCFKKMSHINEGTGLETNKRTIPSYGVDSNLKILVRVFTTLFQFII